MSYGEYPITTSRSGQRVHRRIRCDLCDTTHVKIIRTIPIRESETKVRIYECRECNDISTRQPHRFKIVVV